VDGVWFGYTTLGFGGATLGFTDFSSASFMAGATATDNQQGEPSKCGNLISDDVASKAYYLDDCDSESEYECSPQPDMPIQLC
jgi:hypothetical protein